MKKIVKEQLNEAYDDEVNDSGPFIEDDGWGKEALEEVGLMDWIENVERIAYELRNARRGSYGVSGDTLYNLIMDLIEVKDNLDSIIGVMQDYE